MIGAVQSQRKLHDTDTLGNNFLSDFKRLLYPPDTSSTLLSRRLTILQLDPPRPSKLPLGSSCLFTAPTKLGKRSNYMPSPCAFCTLTIFCIEDAGFILCPQCRAISPAHDISSNTVMGSQKS